MSEEKTEKATAKKRRDAREKGQVLKSTEATVAISAIIMFAFVLIYWPTLTQQLMKILTDYLGNFAQSLMAEPLSSADVTEIFREVVFTLISVLLPILGAALLVGIIGNVLQVGFLFSTKAMKPSLGKISPLKGFKRIFSLRTITELIKSILKIVCLGYIFYSDYNARLLAFPSYVGKDIFKAFLDVMSTAFSIALKMFLVLGIIAAFDFIYQWWQFEKDLMMTKQEVKDEYKMTEGDPQIKNKIKQKQRQMSAMRMMQRVPLADVVITNPTHYAVALRYEEHSDAAPVVIAKGQDYIAQKIKEAAREANIEIVENKPLAQALYALCEIDQEIPAEFYQAVADILVFVYKQKQNNKLFRREVNG